MPAPDDDEVVFRVDPDDVGAVADGGEAGFWGIGPLLALGVEPPKVAVVGAVSAGLRGIFEPSLGDQLAVVPATVVQDQQAEAGEIFGVRPDATTPAGSAADGTVGVGIGNPAPGVGGSDGAHDVGFQDFRNGLFEELHQVQGEAVDTDIVVLVKGAGVVEGARGVASGSELFRADEGGNFTKHGAIPLAFLLEMILPRDFGVVRGSVAAVVDVLGDGIVNVFNKTLGYGEATDGGKEAFGGAVDGIDGFHIAEGGDDVAVAENEAVGGGALLGDGAQGEAEGLDLIAGEIPIAAVGLGIFDGGLEFQFVKAELGGGFRLPLTGGRKVGLRRERQSGENQEGWGDPHGFKFLTNRGVATRRKERNRLLTVVDIHSHVLWGVDDGAPTIEVSLEMLRLAAEAGTTDIVCTPHSNGEFEYLPEIIDARIAELTKLTGGVPRIHRGCDLHLSFDNISEAMENPRKFAICGGRYVLVECSDLHISGSMDKVLDRLLGIDLVPIVTHPERNPILQKEMTKLDGWVEQGCLVQVTALSVLGGFGKRAEATATALLAKGQVHVFASDAHDPVHRHPKLDEAFAVIASRYGEDIARMLFVENPARIIRGQYVTAERWQRAEPRKWWEFWKGEER